jgi:ATP synthase subunit 6
MFSLANPMEQFELVSLLPIHFGNVDISFTNSSLLMVLSVCTMVLLVQLITINGGGTIVPNRWQIIIEEMYNLILNMLLQNVGSRGLQFFPLVFSLFSFVLMCNLLGMVPYSFTATSHFAITFGLALMVFVAVNIVLIQEHGIKALGFFMPPGCPMVLAPMLVAIEFIGHFFKVISLSVRLFANMTAGHCLLKIFAGFAWTMLTAGGFMIIAHFLPLAILFPLIGLEFGVAIVQAYVFSILICIYLQEAVHMH